MIKPSGRFLLRIEPELHLALRERAGKLGCSLNDYCRRLLQVGVSEMPSAEHGMGNSVLGAKWLAAIKSQWMNELAGIALFGSAARGELFENSDIDVLIVLAPGRRPNRSYYADWDRNIAAKLAGNTAREISPHFVGFPEASERVGGIWFEVAIDGIVLWEQDFCVSRVLADIRTRLAQGKLERKIVHGHPYWYQVAKSA